MAYMVIGGNGFVGSHVLRELVDRGERPICFDPAPTSPLVADLADSVEFVQGDASDLGFLLRTLDKYDVAGLVHLPSLVTFASQLNPVKAYQINIGTTVNVLEAARSHELKRIVYASSLAVYGRTPEGVALPEDYPMNPVSLYGATKVYCEQMGRAYADQFGIDFAAIRYPGMWGPGQELLMTGKSLLYGSGKFAELAAKPAKGQKAVVPGVNETYELYYIKDSRRLTVDLLLAPKLNHRAYNAGCETKITLRQAAELIKRRLPKAEIEFEEGVEFKEGYDFAMPCGNYLDISRAREELGYEPRFKPAEAADDYLRELGVEF